MNPSTRTYINDECIESTDVHQKSKLVGCTTTADENRICNRALCCDPTSFDIIQRLLERHKIRIGFLVLPPESDKIRLICRDLLQYREEYSDMNTKSMEEVSKEGIHQPKNRHPSCNNLDVFSCMVVLFKVLTGEALFHVADHSDIGYRFFIWGGGLSTRPINARSQQAVAEASHNPSCMPEMYRILKLYNQYVKKMPKPLLELFENTLCVAAEYRWTKQQILESEWMTVSRY